MVNSLKFDETRKDEDHIRIRSEFYQSLDFSLYTKLDTIELADQHFYYDGINKNPNTGIKTLIISGGLRIRLGN
jgi:hypothetical protein